MPSAALSFAKRLNNWANRHEVIFLFWTLILLLRAPNLAEPYWYGDEAIYLTIGVALKNGAILYKDIVDHKTPLIYYLAMVPSQFWFRILLIVWSLFSTSFFFVIAKRWLNRWAALLATLVFVLFSTLPWLEGHIPNGELFVTGFLLAGMWLASSGGWWQHFNHIQDKAWNWNTRQLLAMFGAGAFLSLALLTKVPAVLDIGAVGSVGLFAILSAKNKAKWWPRLRWLAVGWTALVAGILLPFVLSIVYYALRGAAADYLQFGLLYNFHYSGNWTLPFTQPWLLALFTLPGKAAVLVLIFVISLVIAWRQPKQALGAWLGFWFAAALFGSLLSNRPYPHYLLQLVPPAALALGYMFERITAWSTRLLLIVVFALSAAATVLLGFRFYEVQSYYTSAVHLLTGKTSPTEYRHSFNWIVSQNEELVPAIQELVPANEPIFVWGTNPMLYAQSKRAPAARFTVAFHIHDLKNYDEVFEQITSASPKVIVVMKAEQDWPELSNHLLLHYMPIMQTNDMTLYHLRAEPLTWLIQ